MCVAEIIPRATKFLAKTRKAEQVLTQYMLDHDLNIPVKFMGHSSPDASLKLDDTEPIQQDFNRFFHGMHTRVCVLLTHSFRSFRQVWHEIDKPALGMLGPAPGISHADRGWGQDPRARRHEAAKHCAVPDRRRADAPPPADTQRGACMRQHPRRYARPPPTMLTTVAGFGHYINEARSLGALVLATNYGPMNEFIRDGAGVAINYTSTAHEDVHLFNGIQVNVSPENICDAVQAVLQMPLEERKRIAARARQGYLRDYQRMQQNMRELVEETRARMPPVKRMSEVIRLEEM